VFGSILHFIFTRIHLFDLNFDDINNDPLAIGIFLFCYQVFLGLIIFASLNVPLG
jgi:succinate-acetate transporter protein